jgi:hypothetical protein
VAVVARSARKRTRPGASAKRQRAKWWQQKSPILHESANAVSPHPEPQRGTGMVSKTEKKIMREAKMLAEWFPKQAKQISHAALTKAKRISKRGNHKPITTEGGDES